MNRVKFLKDRRVIVFISPLKLTITSLVSSQEKIHKVIKLELIKLL